MYKLNAESFTPNCLHGWWLFTPSAIRKSLRQSKSSCCNWGRKSMQNFLSLKKRHALCMMWVKLKTWFIHWVQDDTVICLKGHLWDSILKQTDILWENHRWSLVNLWNFCTSNRAISSVIQYNKTLNNIFEFCRLYFPTEITIRVKCLDTSFNLGILLIRSLDDS